MHENKFIILASDDASRLSVIQKGLESFHSYSFVSANRTTDLINLVKKLGPVLVVMSFRNNQMAIDNLNVFSKEISFPILCLAGKFENRNLNWASDTIVFTESIEEAASRNFLHSRVSSILQLVLQTSKTAGQLSLIPERSSPDLLKYNKDLSRLVLELDQKGRALTKVKELIKKLCGEVPESTRTELISIVNAIKVSTSDQKHWRDFKIYFENINPDFIQMLSERHPSLTPTDLKYCCYLKMNMSNNEIRHILGINQESVRTHKYRLKKKMTLSKEQNLRSYVGSIFTSRVREELMDVSE